MPEDQPQQQAPADPFTALHVGWIGVVEMYRHIRRAGAGYAEGAFLAAGFVIMNGRADAPGPQPGDSSG